MSINELYRATRNQIRELPIRDSLDVIWAYNQYLSIEDFELPNNIEAAPAFLNDEMPQATLPEWRFEQIAREVIRYSDEAPRRGRTLRQWNTLARIARTLLDLEDEIYRELAGGRIQLELMRMSHRQFVWQQNRWHWRWIIRYYKLLNTPSLSAQAVQALGLTIDQIFQIGLIYLGIFSERPRVLREGNVNLPGFEQSHIDLFLAFTCLGRTELARRLRAEHVLDEGYPYRYSSLRAFPLVQLSHNGVWEISCPVPMLLFWRITAGLYYELKEQPGFPAAFGTSFQNHVGEVLQSGVTSDEMEVLPEAEYRIGRNRKDTVDWIVRQGDEAALFLECKTKRMTWASKAGLTDLAALDQDIRKLAWAVVQVYRTIGDYRLGHYPNLAFVEGRHIYPMIVTLEDWYLFGMELPTRLDDAVRVAMTSAGLPLMWLDEMPYSIIAIDDLEKCAGVVNAVGIHSFFQGKLRDPEMRRWAYGSYCSHRYLEIVRSLPVLFRDEYDALFEGMGR